MVLGNHMETTMGNKSEMAGEKFTQQAHENIAQATSNADTAMKNGADAMKNGADALKTGFDKATKGYDQFLGYGKETAEAYVKAANVTGKGVETFNQEVLSFSKRSIEDSVAATKAVLASKTVQEAFELQSDFAKTAFDAYVGQMSKLSEIVLSTSKEAFAPIQGRMQAWMDVAQNNRAI